MVSTNDVNKSNTPVRPSVLSPSMTREATQAATPSPARSEAHDENLGRDPRSVDKPFVSQGLLDELQQHGEAIDVNTGRRVVGDSVENARYEDKDSVGKATK